MPTFGTVDALGRLKAKCRLPNRAVAELSVVDISPAGCMIERRAWTLRVNDRVLIKLPDLEYRPATVIWADDENAGIEFEQLLYEPILLRFRNMLGKSGQANS